MPEAAVIWLKAMAMRPPDKHVTLAAPDPAVVDDESARMHKPTPFVPICTTLFSISSFAELTTKMAAEGYDALSEIPNDK
jgi:hypothetical protein